MLHEHLSQALTTLASCWRLERPDGVTLGFTSHDRDIWAEGVRYRSRPGMTPSAIVADNGLTPADMDISGILDEAGLSASDLDAGRWAGTQVVLFMVDWCAPDQGQIQLIQGNIGDVARDTGGGKQFRTSIVDRKLALSDAVGVTCTPYCRAEFGDRRCGVDLAGRSILASVTSSEGREVVVSQPIVDADLYGFGQLRVVSGRMAGLDRTIMEIVDDRIYLEELWDTPVSAGDVIRLQQGCDKRFSTCSQRFGNARNFGGEPFVPGNDALLRYGEL